MPFKRSMPCKTFISWKRAAEEFRLLLLVRWRSNMPPHCWDAVENRISFPKQTRPIGFHNDSNQGLSFPMIFNVLKVQLDQAENEIKFGRGCQATGFSRDCSTSQWSDQCPLSASRNGVDSTWVDSHSYCYCTKLLTELSDISRKWAGLPRGRISANYMLLVFTFTHCLWPGFLERRCILGAFANWESVSGPSIRHQPWPQYGHHTQCHHTGSKQEIPCPSPSAVNTNVFQSIRVWSKKVYFFLLLSGSFFCFMRQHNSRCN